MVTEAPGLAEEYAAACQELGTEPGPFFGAAPETVTNAFIEQDIDAAWAEIGPHLLHDNQVYHRWNAAAKGKTNPFPAADTYEDLRRAGYPYRIFTPNEAVNYIKERGMLNVNPLCGGLPPEIGWRTLHNLADHVLPQL
jgi:hypothetical protein